MTRRQQPECRPPIFRVVEDVTPEVVAGFVREAIEAGYQAVYLHPQTLTTKCGSLLPSIPVIAESSLPENGMLALDEPPPMLPWEAP